MDNAMKARILQAQKNEITEHLVYKKLAGVVKEQKNRQVLEKIADDELKHYEFWKKQTSEDVNANTFKVWLIYLLAVIFILLRMDYYHYFLRIRRTLQSNNKEKKKDSTPPPPAAASESK